MENRKLSTLNEYQKITLDKFSRDGLKASDFDERNWFNDFYHYRAFLFMVEDKKFSFDQAFLALDKLNKDQVFGILHGLHHDYALETRAA